MTDSEPGGTPSGPMGPPPRPPGPAPDGYLPSDSTPGPPPPQTTHPGTPYQYPLASGAPSQSPATPPRPASYPPAPYPPAPYPPAQYPPAPARYAPYPPQAPATYESAVTAAPPPPGVALRDTPFLDTPWVPPQTKRQGWMWLVYAIVGFLVGQLAALLFGLVAGAIAGKTSAQMQAIATASVPPEWYVVSTLLGLWVGFFGAPWLASRTQGTRNFVRDLGLRFRWWDLLGILIGLGGQILVAVMYAPFQHDIKNFNGPSQRLTGAAHGPGFVVIAIATVLLAPAMEELFFRGLLLKALVRIMTPLRAAGGARTAAVVVAIIVDGLLFGLAHGEWIQLAGLASFGAILAVVSYRTGRLGMNMVAHASFNLVAIIAIASQSGVIHFA